jgi:hypothetical protein
MHDPEHEHHLDEALAALAHTATSRDGHRWHIQPLRLLTLFTTHTLIVMEQSDGPYEPVGIASSQDEALDLISHDYHRRKPENDDLCPEGYALWNRDPNGHYRRAAEITKA